MDSTNSIQIPLQSEQITPEWLSQALHVEIHPQHFSLTSNVSVDEGTGFLSNLVRLSCQEKEEKQQQQYHLIIKLLPNTEPFRSIVIGSEFDKTEILTYQKVLPELIRVDPELEKYLCKHIYSNFVVASEGNSNADAEYGSVLVLEDLKPLGYYMIDFVTESMTMSQIEGILDFLAKFHAAAKKLEGQKSANLIQIFPFLERPDDYVKGPAFYAMFKEGLIQLESIVDPNSSTLANYKKLIPFCKEIVDIGVDVKSDTPWRTLIHGDLWSNNVLFKKNEDETFKIIDWQILNYSDSTKDIAMFIYSSLTLKDLNINIIDKLVRLYYKKFLAYTGIMYSHNSEEEFVKHFHTYGLICVFVWFIFSLEPFMKDIPRLIGLLEFFDKEMNVTKLLLEHLPV